MKKLILLLFVLSIGLLFTTNIFAQAATVTWSLATSTAETGSTGNAAGTAEVIGAGMGAATYTNAFQVFPAKTWPTTVTTTGTNFLDFPIGPNAGYNLAITQISITGYNSGGAGNIAFNAYLYNGTTFTNLNRALTINTTNTAGVTFNGAVTANVPNGSTYHIYLFPTGSTRSPHIKNFIITGTTASVAPIIATNTITAIGTTTATGGGNITALGVPAITVSGICWNTTGAPTTADNLTTNGRLTVGSFNSNMTGLTAGQLYHVRAYATNTGGTVYGGDSTFTTLASVTTTAITNINVITATSGGTVTSAGAYTQQGVCWNTALNPTIANNHTSDGAGLGGGTYVSTITGFNASTLYHVRAYVTNVSGTSYGGDLTFTSPPATATILTDSTTLSSFGSLVVNSTSSEKIFHILALYLTPATGNVTVTAPAGFEVSLTSGSGFSGSVNVPYTGGALTSTSIYVHFIPALVQGYSGNITNGGGGAITVNVAVSGTGVAVNPPTVLAVNQISNNIIHLTWTAPVDTYEKVLIFGQVGSDVTLTPSGAGSAYTGADVNWLNASTWGGGNDKLLYAGTGADIEITGVANGQHYFFKGFAYNGNAYSSAASVNGVTGVQDVTAFTADSGAVQSNLNWVNPPFNVTQSNYWDEVLIIAKEGSAVNQTPTGNGSSYTANLSFGSGTDLGGGNFVVYKGSASPEVVTNLTVGTVYYFKAFVRHGSVWSTGVDASEMPVGIRDINMPLTYAVSQNYPNPFNPSTTINYEVPTVSKVMIKVYNILGAEVATLVNENKEAGRYQVIFDASRYSSGVYFYRITAGNFVQTKKMILMK